MTAEEYFGDWIKVIDKKELAKVMHWLQVQNEEKLCPAKRDIFKAFRLCPMEDCKVVIIAQDPYPQKGVATGLAFANSADTKEKDLSPSLKVLEEAMVDYARPHGTIRFDYTLESLAKQGVLLLNSALTCEVNKIGSHIEIWKPFIEKFVKNFSYYNWGIMWFLFGSQAWELKKHIYSSFFLKESYHPAYYARQGIKMPSDIFFEMNFQMFYKYAYKLKFYDEIDFKEDLPFE